MGQLTVRRSATHIRTFLLLKDDSDKTRCVAAGYSSIFTRFLLAQTHVRRIRTQAHYIHTHARAIHIGNTENEMSK